MSQLNVDIITGRDGQAAPEFTKGAIITGVATATTLNQNATGDLTVGRNLKATGITTSTGGFVGNLTGNVTGSVTGNSDSATALQNARTIGGVSFDGTSNITLAGVNTTGNQNTEGTAAGVHGTPDVTIRNVSAGIATYTGAITGTTATFSGNISVGGTITYDDVTSVDSVGIVTARQDLKVLRNVSVSGVSTLTGQVDVGGLLTIPDTISHTGDTDTKIRFAGADTITAETACNERVRINSDGRILVGTDTPFSTTGYRKVQIGQADGGWVNLARTAVAGDGNHLGAVQAFSKSADGNYHPVAGVDIKTDGVPSNTSKPSRIEVYTTAASSTTQTERLRISKDGALGFSGANYGSSGQVLTSQGSAAAPQWSDSAGGVNKVHPVYFSNTSASFNSQAGAQIGGTGVYYPPSGRIGGAFTKTTGTSRVLVTGMLTYAMNNTNIHGFCVWLGGDEANYVNTGGDARMFDFYTTRDGNICVWPFSYCFNTSLAAGTQYAYAAPTVAGNRAHTGELNPDPNNNIVNNQGDTPGDPTTSSLTVIEFEP